ncbi:MAG: hypothetical protein ABEN55_21915, partial [Bradymonadaceae bacterium]
FQLGSERRPVRGEVSAGDDVDWYAIRAVEGEEWLIILEARPDGELNPRIDLEISSEDSGQLTYDNDGAGRPERIRHLGVTDEVVRFAVRAGGGQT